MGAARRTAAAAGAAACAFGLLAGCSGSSGPGHRHVERRSGSAGDQLVRHDKANDTYGSLPTYLPTNSVDNNAPITGRPRRPAVTSEGDEVLATVGAAHVRATVSGPVVPGEGLPDPPDATTCTWRVTMSTTGGTVAVSARDFNTLDHLGTIYRVAPVAGRPRVPHAVLPGHPVTFELRTVMPTGEGVMRWSPDRRTILGEWDFTVEND